jgi:hypothetical protein
MKHLIKSLMAVFVVVVSVTLCGIVFNSARAQEVGERMPSLEGYIFNSSGQWVSPGMTKNGISERLGKPEAQYEKYFVAYNECGGVKVELPFGIYDMDTNILYLDNAPTDGIIDAIVSGPENPIYEDAPDCEE